MSGGVRLAALLIATIFAASCGSTGPSSESATSDPSSTFRAASQVSISDTDIGLAVFRGMLRDARGRNAVMSPWGFGRAMDVLYNAAAGQTRSTMSRALRLEALDLAMVDDGNKWLDHYLATGRGGVSIQTADALWYQAGLEVNPEFADRIASGFGARSQSIDFGSRDAGARISDWVRENSAGEAQDYRAPVDRSTRAVFVDVLRMDALWNTHFDPALTRPHAFTTAGGRRTTVPMMKITNTFPYVRREGFQVVSIPYVGWQFSMDIFLPDRSSDGMSSVESLLSAIPLDNLLGGAPHAKGTVEIPRFDIAVSSDLKRLASPVGLGPIFDGDFSGMWAHDAYPLDQVIQRCYVSVNESGTRAGSATSFTIQALIKPRPPFTFVADHPFVFLIRDREMGTVLFAGIVNTL